jgi:hypothetical protein
MDRIDFYLPSFSKQKITQRIQSFVELHEKYFRLVYEFYADEPNDEDDEGLGWNNSFTDLDLCILKEAIYAIEIGITINPIRYRVAICYSGNDSTRIYFRKKEEATEMAAKIKKWLCIDH